MFTKSSDSRSGWTHFQESCAAFLQVLAVTAKFAVFQMHVDCSEIIMDAVQPLPLPKMGNEDPAMLIQKKDLYSAKN